MYVPWRLSTIFKFHYYKVICKSVKSKMSINYNASNEIKKKNEVLSQFNE